MRPLNETPSEDYVLPSREALSLRALVNATEKLLAIKSPTEEQFEELLLSIWQVPVTLAQVKRETGSELFYVMLRRNKVDEEVRALLKIFCKSLLAGSRTGLDRAALENSVSVVRSKFLKVLVPVPSPLAERSTGTAVTESPLPRSPRESRREQKIRAKERAAAAVQKSAQLFEQTKLTAQVSFLEMLVENGIEPQEITPIQFEYLRQPATQALFRKAYAKEFSVESLITALRIVEPAAGLLRAEQRTQDELARAKKEERQRWEARLVTVADMREILGVTEAELKQWKDKPELAPALIKSFKKWGKSNALKLYDIDALKANLTPDVLAKWRAESYSHMSANALSSRQRSVHRAALRKELRSRWEKLCKQFDCVITGDEVAPYLFNKSFQVTLTCTLDNVTYDWAANLLLEQPCAPPNSLEELVALETTLVVGFSEEALALATNQLASQCAELYNDFCGEMTPGQKTLLRDSLRTALKTGVPVGGPLDKLNARKYLRGPIDKVLKSIEEQRARDLLRLQDFPQAFPLARKLERKIHFKLGPTNSGKTHAALEALKSAGSGVYLAPLRLLAMEIRDRLTAQGIPCNLLTGEERIIVPEATHTACTVEMLNPEMEVEVAVIDEIQMLDDPERGWAWTSALVGAPAKDVYVCGADTVHESCLRALSATGEAYDTERLVRKTSLQVVPFNGKAIEQSKTRSRGRRKQLKQLEKGDAVIAFSRKDVLTLSARYREEGFSVATIYGALAAEVRRTEAERFSSGKADVLVATDAIGMGLNLPIRRVIFSTINKFDGTDVRLLNPTEVHQIAGRAGRFGIYPEGFVTTLDEQELRHVQLMLERPVPATNKLLPIAPSIWHIEALSSFLGTDQLGEILSFFCSRLAVDSKVFETASLGETTLLARQVDHLTRQSVPAVSLRDKFTFACAPISTEKAYELEYFKECLGSFLTKRKQSSPAVPTWLTGSNPQYLEQAEQLSKQLGLYAWLGSKYPATFCDQESLVALRLKVSRFIEKALLKQDGFGQTSKEAFKAWGRP